MARPRLRGLALLLATAGLAACGGETTDVSAGVDQLNKQLSPTGAKFDCPKEVDGGVGTTFECTLTAKGADKSTPVTLEVAEEEGQLAVDAANEQEFQRALERVVGGS